MRCRSVAFWGPLFGCALMTTAASANGRFPAAGQLVFAPDDPSTLAIRATFGVLVSRDSGKTWDWICEKAMGYGGSVEDPSIALTSGPGLLVGTQEGLATSGDACSWTLFPALGSPIMDLVVRKDDPKGAIALVSVAGKVDDAGNATYQNILYGTKDSGAS